jgi:hypothetical protein
MKAKVALPEVLAVPFLREILVNLAIPVVRFCLWGPKAQEVPKTYKKIILKNETTYK